jgi:hypothetical protein
MYRNQTRNKIKLYEINKILRNHQKCRHPILVPLKTTSPSINHTDFHHKHRKTQKITAGNCHTASKRN